MGADCLRVGVVGVAAHLQLPAGARALVVGVQAQRFAQEGQRRDVVQQHLRASRFEVDRVVADRRRLADQHLRVREPAGLQPRVAGLVEAAVDARRGGRAVRVPLRQQEGGVVGLVPDRVERDLASRSGGRRRS